MMNVIDRLFFKLARTLFIFFSTRNMPKLSGLCLCILCVSFSKKRKYRVFCLGRNVFYDDVHVLSESSDEIQYLYFPLKLLSNFVGKQFAGCSEQVTESNYHELDEFSSARKEIYEFMSKMLFVVMRFRKFDAVLSGNFGYINQQEIFSYCRNKGIPVIVLYKEGLALYTGLGIDVYKGKSFIGDRLLCYNERSRQGLLDAGIKGLTKDMTSIVGVPRLDSYNRYHNKKNKDIISSCGVDKIVFFAFYPGDKFFSIREKSDVYSEALLISKNFHKWVIRFSQLNPSYETVIKTKESSIHINYVTSLIDEQCGQSCPDNLSVVWQTDIPKLINSASVVIGFNSTTLVESIMLSRTIISPDFSSTTEDGSNPCFLSGYENFVKYVDSFESLEENLSALGRKNNADYEYDNRRRCLESFIFKDDGLASSRTNEEILSAIKQKKRTKFFESGY